MAIRTPFDTAASADRRGTSAEGACRSASHRTYFPKMPTWSIVWLAPLSRSSAGLSAVRSSKGTSDWDASTTAGNRLATAVPDDVMTAQGLPVALPCPRAQNPSERSSMPGTILARGCCATANVSGEDLEPGATQKVLHPHRHSSSTMTCAARMATFCDDRIRSSVEFLNRLVNWLILRSSSFHSLEVMDPGTMPTPAYRSTLPAPTRLDRIATAISAAFFENHPNGPA